MSGGRNKRGGLAGLSDASMPVVRGPRVAVYEKASPAAVDEVRRGLTPEAERLLGNFELLAEAPGGVKKVRELVLDLAVRGRLTCPEHKDGSVSTLLDQIEATRQELLEAGSLRGFSRERDDECTRAQPIRSLPTHWSSVRIGDTFDVVGGIQKTPQRLPRQNHYPYLRVENVQRGRLDLSRVERFEMLNGELDRWRLKAEDLLVVEGNGSEAEIGRCALWGGSIQDCVHQNHIMRCRPIAPMGSRFVLLFLNSPRGMQEMRELAITTSGLYSLSVGKIRQIVVPLPPLAEQKRIVAKVDQLMALCDSMEARQAKQRDKATRLTRAALGELAAAEGPEELEESWQRVNGTFDALLDTSERVRELRDVILELATRGRLVSQEPKDEPAASLLRRLATIGYERADDADAEGRSGTATAEKDLPFALPKSWIWCSLVDLIDPAHKISYGVLVPGPDVDDGVPFVRVQDLDVYNPPSLPNKRIASTVEEKYPRSRLVGGELLLGVVGSIGKVGIAPATWRGANIARAVCRLRPHPVLGAEYMALVIQSRSVQAYFERSTRTLAQPTLNVGMIRTTPVPLPPLAEQKRIVAKVDQLMKICDALEAALRHAEDKARRLADALVAEIAG